MNMKDKDGNTALIWAAWRGHSTTVKILPAKGADVNAKDNDGNTALMVAAKTNIAQLIKKQEQKNKRKTRLRVEYSAINFLYRRIT
jgi:ankyrin repeat protein